MYKLCRNHYTRSAGGHGYGLDSTRQVCSWIIVQLWNNAATTQSNLVIQSAKCSFILGLLIVKVMKYCFQHVKGVKWKPPRHKDQDPEVEFENITVAVALTGHLTWICPEMGSGRSWKLNYLDDHPKKRSKPYHWTSGSSKKKKSGRQLDKEDRAWLVSHMEHSPEVSCSCHPSL